MWIPFCILKMMQMTAMEPDLTLTGANDKSSRIHFARPSDIDAGGFYYSHTTDNFTFVSAGVTRMQLGPGAGSLPEVELFGDLSVTALQNRSESGAGVTLVSRGQISGRHQSP